jgi:hypothetical protein
MKFILLHLSDIHFKDSEGQNPVLSRTKQIAAAAASTAPTANCCFLAVTGDIAFSGKQAEYTLADEFFRDLRTHLRSRLSECDFHFVSVPGNHDCDFPEERDTVRELVLSGLTPSDLDEDVFAQCTGVQSDYEKFAAQWRTENVQRDILSKIYAREVYDLQGGAVEFRLINSAWMSTLEEHQGSLRFPPKLLQEGTDRDSASTLVVTMLHHPYNWFEATNARALRSELVKTSDIILTGHEHDVDYYGTVRPTGERIEYLEGGVLQVSDDPGVSWFNVLVVDLDEEMQEVHTFSWNNGNGRYEPEGTPVPTVFQRNRYRLRHQFLLKKSFEEFLTDPGASFTHPDKKDIFLEDLFVYPDLLHVDPFGKEESPIKLIQDQVPTFVLNHRHVLLVGPENCGKTTLSKVLFRDLRENGFVPIYICGSEWKAYTESTLPSSIKRAFEDIYESPDVIAFDQLERRKKAIIVDDFDKSRFNVRARTHIINALKSLFDVVVLFGGENLRFDELITQQEEEPAILEFTQCQIPPFGNLRRADLIRKWYFLGRHLTYDESELSRRAVQAEKIVSSLLGKNFIPSYPIFILILLQNMEAYTPLVIAPRSGSYGYLFESLLTMALVRSSKLLKDDLDTTYTYLSELAYFLFTTGTYSISTEEALDWHQRHCKKYRVGFDFFSTLSDLCEVSVLCRDDNTIHFRYPFMYFYFVGRYFGEHIDQEEIRDHIRSMSKRLHHTESANILMFLSYLSKDPLILSSILRASQDLFSSYPECDLAENNRFLNGLMKNVPQLVLDSSDPEERRRKLLARKDELEPAQVDQEDDKVMDDELVDAGELEEQLQLNVAFKTIQILGQVLRNFHGSLEAEKKLELARECYSLGLRVLKFMLNSVEVGQENLIQFLVEFLRSRNPNWSDEKLTDSVKDFLFFMVEALSFVVIKHVSDSIGLDRLSLTFHDLLEEDDRTSYKFIDLSVRLDFYPTFPKKEVLQVYKHVERNLFSAHLLRRLVWYYFYIYDAPRRLRQSVCSKLDIKLLPHVHDKRVKRLKGR